MSDKRDATAVDTVLAEWAVQRPDLDATPILTFTAIVQAGRLVEEFYEASAARHGILGADFFLLAALRRRGEPFEATPGELSGLLVRSTGGMTKQIDRNEAAGLIERVPNPADRRSQLVRLTTAGRDLIDTALEDHFEAEAELLAPLGTDQISTTVQTLRQLIVELQATASHPPAEPRRSADGPPTPAHSTP